MRGVRKFRATIYGNVPATSFEGFPEFVLLEEDGKWNLYDADMRTLTTWGAAVTDEEVSGFLFGYHAGLVTGRKQGEAKAKAEIKRALDI